MAARAQPDLKQVEDPWAVVGVARGEDWAEYQAAFREKLRKLGDGKINDNNERRRLCLAYSIVLDIGNEDTKYKPATGRYKLEGTTVKVLILDVFYHALVNNADTVLFEVRKNRSLLTQKDQAGSSLLYSVVRSGYFLLAAELLRLGADPNETQVSGSTPLHAAAFFGHDSVLRLLLEHGADIRVRNNFGQLAIEEDSLTEKARVMLQAVEKSAAATVLTGLVDEKLCHPTIRTVMLPIDRKNVIVCRKAVSRALLDDPSLLSEVRHWPIAWHGTKLKYVPSIMKHGLQAPGSQAGDTVIHTQQGHIDVKHTVAGIPNWAAAIFVSPSVFYAAHYVYSESLSLKEPDEKAPSTWRVLFQCYVRPGSFSSHPHTFKQRDDALPNEPDNVEYRVASDVDDETIFRVADRRNCVVAALVLVRDQFLRENASDFRHQHLLEAIEELPR
eukprot:m.262623 g.262623  ORF g.262623 m.262623 type:complete len:444 (-) comp25642_c0_seq1:87-1418(-)